MNNYPVKSGDDKSSDGTYDCCCLIFDKVEKKHKHFVCFYLWFLLSWCYGYDYYNYNSAPSLLQGVGNLLIQHILAYCCDYLYTICL